MGRAKGAKFSSFRSSGGRLRNRTQRSWGQGWRTLGESHSVQWGYKAGGRLENRTQCSGGQGCWDAWGIALSAVEHKADDD
jgi:hypothetical protein